MVKINYQELNFDHLVIFEKDSTIFACARENSGHTRIFLLFESGNGRVYTRNGKIDSWELLPVYDAGTIRARVQDARNERIPVFTINGNHID